MKKLVLLFLCGCAAAPIKATVPSPQWTDKEQVWVDPHPPASFGFGGNMEKAAQLVRDALLQAGMQAGAETDPETLQVKLEETAGMVDFTITYKLLRGPRLLEDQSFVANDLPCWKALSTVNTKMQCVAQNVVDRILTSKALAQEHAARAPAAQAHVRVSGRLAVLDLRNLTKELGPDDARYFTDLVRASVLKINPQLEVMTRENLLVLLQSTGKDLANCEGECEVDTGRRIGADAIVSGEIQKVGSRYKLNLRLHETHEGRLAGAAQASGKSVDELDDAAQKAVAALFEGTK